MTRSPTLPIGDFAAAAVSDLLSLVPLPGSSILGVAAKAALDDRLQRRSAAAQRILFQELQQGSPVRPEELGETVEICHRYARAVHEGVGRVNLRMLAAVINGQILERAVYADEFYRWADVLASLSRDEIVVLGLYMRLMPEPAQQDPVAVASAVFAELADKTWDDFESIRGAMLRTGFLSLRVTGGAVGDGSSVIYMPTRRLAELSRLVDVEAVLGRDRQFDDLFAAG